ncbi:MAG: hypothetical protein VB049_06385 [Candidatus Pelethousia sp.]|nr:hypothetical protein [Candidatus Pelethousia sp.]
MHLADCRSIMMMNKMCMDMLMPVSMMLLAASVYVLLAQSMLVNLWVLDERMRLLAH